MAGVTTPPAHLQYAYRLLGVRLPREYDAWVAQDVASKSFLNWRTVRRLLWLLTAIALYTVGQTMTHQRPDRVTLVRLGLGAVAVSLLSSGTRLGRRALAWQRIDKRGRPAAPRGLGLLTQVEAALAVVLLAIGVTHVGALLGHAQRPTGAAASIPCDETSRETIDRLLAGVNRKDARVERAKSIRFRGGELVSAVLSAPDEKDPEKRVPALEVWLVEGERITTLPRDPKEPPTWSTFPEPEAADRVAGEARTRALRCLAQATQK